MMSRFVLFQPASDLLLGVDLVGPDGAPIEAMNAGRPRAQRRPALRACVARCEAAGPFTGLLASGKAAHGGDPSGVISTVVAGAR